MSSKTEEPKVISQQTGLETNSGSDAEAYEDLHTALICDVLDELGHRSGFLGPDVVALQDDMRVVGRAFTLSSRPVKEVPARLYEKLLAAQVQQHRENPVSYS